MKKVLVTGGNGFIGSNLIRRLLKDGHEVHAILRPAKSYPNLEGVDSHIQFHNVERIDSPDVEAIVRAVKPEWVFHVAAYGGSSWHDDTLQMADVNVRGTIRLLDACVKVGFEKFINTGTSSEYGFKNTEQKESDLLEPASCYAVTKACATHYCSFVGKSKNLPIATLRLYSVFGPFENEKRLIPRIISFALHGHLPPLCSPNSAHDYIYVDDVINAYMLAASTNELKPGVIYNVGSGIQWTLSQVVDMARKHLIILEEPKWGSMPNRKWDTQYWQANTSAIEYELGWQREDTFLSGFKKTCDWWHRKLLHNKVS